MVPKPQDEKFAPGVEPVRAGGAIRGRMLRGLLLAAPLLVLASAAIWTFRQAAPAGRPVPGLRAESSLAARKTVQAPRIAFADVTVQSGIGFEHESGAYGSKLLPETMGGGVAVFDYDNDGDQDLLFINSAEWPEHRSSAAPTMGLYRNDGTGRFDDVTREAGLDLTLYGQGVAVGDYDNDGNVDVFISALGANRLLRNEGGVFSDVTHRAGVAGDPGAWSTSAGFFDFDNDGDLDLFVCNYVHWSRELDLRLAFTLNGTDRAYGPPKQYPGTGSYLYRNAGDGTFTDVSESMGISVADAASGRLVGKALAVTFADVDQDGFLEIFVANDTERNFVFRNRAGRVFEEVGIESGVGLDERGAATGAMGIDAADVAGDGKLAVGIANFSSEASSFYLQQADPWQFVDVSNAIGFGAATRPRLGFGLFFFDYDLDGRLDLLQANGHIEDTIQRIQPEQQYRQATQLFWNCAETEGCFAAVAEGATGALATPIVGRGAAYLDLDGDGDLDVVLAQTGAAPLVVRNDQDLGHHWLRVKLSGSRSNRDAIGAALELQAGGAVQRRTVMPTRSYLSQVELPVTFGLGTTAAVDGLLIRWPDGQTQQVAVPAVDRTLHVVQPR